jgi:hypothetical protein
MKGYMYALGLSTVAVLPFIAIVDCFYPVLGRGPLDPRNKKIKKA